MKRRIIIGIVLIAATLLSACGTGKAQYEESEKISIVCTTFPVFDWVTEIIGSENEDFEVALLSKSGDLHSYQPSAWDIAKIHNCDLFIYNGGTSDKWTEDVMEDKKVNALRLFDVVKEELICERGEHHHHEHEADYDEHIWLSLRLAKMSVEAIADAVCELVPENAESFEREKTAYIQKLDELDEQYREVAELSSDKTVIFADRFPFLYLTEDYGVNTVAAFPGCSADTDASFEVVAKLVEKIDELHKETILILENSNQSVADTVIQNTEKKTAKIAIMNSCQSIGEYEIRQGASYLEIMTKNLDAFSEALK